MNGAAAAGARIGQIQIGRMPISRVQELEKLRGAVERDVDVLDHRLGVHAGSRASARVTPQRLFQRMIRW